MDTDLNAGSPSDVTHAILNNQQFWSNVSKTILKGRTEETFIQLIVSRYVTATSTNLLYP